MGFIAWTIIALAAGSTALYAYTVWYRAHLPALEMPRDEELPATHLQRYARWTLLEVGFLTTLAAGVIAYFGPGAWWSHNGIRIAVTLVLLVAVGCYLVFSVAIRRLCARDGAPVDERDLVVLNRSGAGAGGAMMVVMAAWIIALVEAYNDTGMVPSYYLYLVFWSLVMTNVIATLAGMLLAYRRG
jgi:hypothetical protein